MSFTAKRSLAFNLAFNERLTKLASINKTENSLTSNARVFVMNQEETNRPRPRPQPRLNSEQEPEPVFGQHIRLLEVNQPQGRVICECYNCKQGLLIQHEREPQQETNVKCPNCGKIAIKLQVAKVLSAIAIPSPWQPPD